MKSFIVAATILLLAPPVARADTLTYWPATRQRVYVVDVRNIGPYGTIRKPAGVDVIVIRQGNKWGVYNPPKSSAPASGGWLGQ